MGSSKTGGKVRVAEYYMSLHIGICAYGRGIQLLNVKFGDKIAWKGLLVQNDTRAIDNLSLYGGPKKEGGVKGLLWWLNGNEAQRLPAALAKRMGMTFRNVPGFRGLASIMLTGVKLDDVEGIEFQFPGFRAATGIAEGGSLEAAAPILNRGRGGFLLGANNPYLKTISARARRAPEGLSPSLALIRLPDNSEGNAQYAANAAHIIFECMTNRDWGMGESFGAFNLGSFEDAAQVLYDEKFGLNMLWTRQTKIQDFIKDVLDHIQGAIFVDPATGKHTLKLLRGDYNPDTLPQINPDNARLTNFKRKVWGEISNEVVVTWTNPETGKEDTVTAQDNGAIAAQGGVSSTSRNYHGIASQELALFVAERDLAAVVHPIQTCDAEVTREFWKSIPYGVVDMSWPEKGVERAIFRISKVSRGESSRTVKLSLYEDVFSLDRASYLEPSDTEWVDPSSPPAPLDNFYLGTAPAFLAAAALGLEDPGELIYPDAISLLVVPPDVQDDIGYELVTYATNTVGETSAVSLGDRILNATWLSTEAIPQEARSTIALPLPMGPFPAAGDFLLAGTTDDASEIMVVRSVTSTGLVVDRGLLDTVPRAWPIGTRFWSIPAVNVAPDVSRRAAFEQVRYHLLTQTSRGTLALADAPEISATLSDRAHLPLRPANVAVGGVSFGQYDLPDAASSVTITWSNRNRADESTQALLWTDPDVVGEAGQTTAILVQDAATSAVIKTITGLTGSSYAFTRSDMGSSNLVRVTVVSQRSGSTSLQGHSINISANFSFLRINATDRLLLSGDASPGRLMI